jgi:putative ABC transport system permease protein
MIKNYIKIAFRNIARQKGYSFINIMGLAIGIACCLIIMLFVLNELSYERHFSKADRIYRITQHIKWNGNSMDVPLTSAPFAAALRNDYPAIENTVRIQPEGGGIIQAAGKQLSASDVFFVDPSIFDVFDYAFLHGDPKTALQQTKSIVLTEELAIKLFGAASQAMGKSVVFDKSTENIVTGVLANPSPGSHIRFSALRALPPTYTAGWQQFELHTYVLLKEGQERERVEAGFALFFDKYLRNEMGNVNFQMRLQPITSIHLHSNLEYELGTNGNVQYVYLFVCIAVLILLIACINYMNLATARSAQRAKEVGIRKTLGSGRGQLAGLFIAESIIITAIAVVLAMVFADLVLPLVNNMMQLDLSFSNFSPGRLAVALGVLVILVGLISGSYPALYLSSFRPVTILKGEQRKSGRPVFRQALVVFQFVVSIVLISCVWVVYEQLHFVNSTFLGFNKDQTLHLHIHDNAARLNVPALKQRLLQHPGVEAAASASNPIGAYTLGKKGVFLETNGVVSSNNNQLVQHLMVDEDFLQTMEINLLNGRNFEPGRTDDSHNAILINEAFAMQAGWGNDPVGKQLMFANDTATVYRVIGLVSDFHVNSLQHKIEPLAMLLAPPKEQDNLFVRISAHDMPATLAFIDKAYKEFDSNNPAEITFVDQTYAKRYETVQQRGRLFMAFTSITLFVACLGLFGLAAFTAEQRTKEIGVRKVLGASISDIITLLSKDFLKLVVLALLIASPFAWALTHKWLEDFAYRIQVSPLVFAGAGLITILIALATISIQSFKAATANPVQSLKTE